MKKILILGANGATAREIIPCLLEQEDIRLTLFLLRAARMQGFKSERVEIVEGDAKRWRPASHRHQRGRDLWRIARAMQR